MVQKYNKVLHQYCVVNDVFTKQEIDTIIDLEDLQKFIKGKVGADQEGTLNEKTRDSDIMWIYHDQTSDWLFRKFGELVSNVNGDFFMYDIELFDAFQYTIYRENNHYNWHIDMGNYSSNYERKISATIMLSDPSEYEGGELHLVAGGDVENPVIMKPKLGDVVFFASWMPHKVAPIVSGVRKSLVVWVLGKRTW